MQHVLSASTINFRSKLNIPLSDLIKHWVAVKNIKLVNLAAILGVHPPQVTKTLKEHRRLHVHPTTYLSYIMRIGGKIEYRIKSNYGLKTGHCHDYVDDETMREWMITVIKEIMSLGRLNAKAIAHELAAKSINGVNMRNIHCFGENSALTMMRQVSILGCEIRIMVSLPGVDPIIINYDERIQTPVFEKDVVTNFRPRRRFGEAYEDLNIDPVEMELISRMQRGSAQTSLGETVRAFL